MLSTMHIQNCRQRRASKGFTLAEILIALGILAIGMSMVAAIFPAAMEFNRRSTNSTLGTIICENGFVLSEMGLTAEIIGESTDLQVYADDVKCTDTDPSAPLSRAQQHYPTGDSESRTGFVMLARKIPATGNTYQLVTVAYRKTDKNNTVALKAINCSVSGKNISGATNLRIGTPLINKATGIFSFVDSINHDGTAGTLERNMSGGSSYVLVERTSTGGDISIADMRRSPAIGAMSKMTGLRHDPEPEPATP